MTFEAVEIISRSVHESSRALVLTSTEVRNRLLRIVATRLRKQQDSILAANRTDVQQAEAAGLAPVMLDRLVLNEKRMAQMIRGIKQVIALPDPIHKVIERKKRPNGLQIEKVRVPLGAIGIVYEARPNVTIDAAVLCLKAGNAVLLRGGSEALNTNRALVEVLRESVRDAGLPAECVGFIDSTDRQDVLSMVKMDRYLDVIIPRGSHQLIRFIQENSSVPVIVHGEGNCHVYVDSPADLLMAEDIVFNAKVQRPSVCNAAEKLLVHKRIAGKFLPRVIKRLRAAGVEVRGDDAVRTTIPDVLAAVAEDWSREYLSLILAVAVVDDVAAAIQHINRYGSHHSDAIITRSTRNAERFLREVDSAAVYVNASTRFTDGFEFGLGAEIGISTQKLHARGPMGLVELTSVKWVVRGKGQVRS